MTATHPDRSHPDREVLALLALPAEPVPADIARHLASCADCRDYAESLGRVAHLAREAGSRPLPPPPPRVWDSILAELGEDASGPDPRAAAAPPAAPDPDRGAAAVVPLRPRRSLWRPAAALVAACALGAALALGLGAVDDPAPQPVAVARLAPFGDTTATATGEVDEVVRDGVRTLVVRLDGVPAAATGDYLECWLLTPDGTDLVSLGGLVGGDGRYVGEFAVPDGLPTTRFSVVDVSAERWDGDEGHSGDSLLRGDLV
jgi:hypothetical protein